MVEIEKTAEEKRAGKSRKTCFHDGQQQKMSIQKFWKAFPEGKRHEIEILIIAKVQTAVERTKTTFFCNLKCTIKFVMRFSSTKDRNTVEGKRGKQLLMHRRWWDSDLNFWSLKAFEKLCIQNEKTAALTSKFWMKNQLIVNLKNALWFSMI